MPSTPIPPRFAFVCLALWLALAAFAAQAAEPNPRTVPDTMAQRMMACTLCHGAQGRATSSGYFPRIAGKPVDYLYNQLLHFRDGRRQNEGMARLLDNLSDAYLRDMAEHFAGLDLPYPPPQPPAVSASVLARGEALVRQGDQGRDIPACMACHGEALTGVSPAIPGLLGLPRDYLIGLQSRITSAIEAKDGQAKFLVDKWEKGPGEQLQGNGITRIGLLVHTGQTAKPAR